ncbi:ATP-binding protein [Aquimarina agarilytica]|uniref:ATP-binding protein n=1 Tax=Aquimarina agarilytica TaxID=1087449 RepID=UPI000287CFF1|nr:ATP-binding protein [Aquimarina agarilytica]
MIKKQTFSSLKKSTPEELFVDIGLTIICVDENCVIHFISGDYKRYCIVKKELVTNLVGTLLPEIEVQLLKCFQQIKHSDSSILKTTIYDIEDRKCIIVEIRKTLKFQGGKRLYVIKLQNEVISALYDINYDEQLSIALNERSFENTPRNLPIKDDFYKHKNKFKTFADSAGVGWIFLDLKLNILSCASEISHFFGIEFENSREMIKKFSEAIIGHDIESLCKQVINTGELCVVEVQNNYGIWFSATIQLDKDDLGQPMGLLLSFFNIHEYKVALIERKKVNDFFGKLVKTSPAVITTYDIKKQQFSYVSSNIARFAGYTERKNEVFNNDFFMSIIYNNDISLLNAHYDDVAQKNGAIPLQIEYRILHKETKKPVWLLATSSVYQRSAAGEVLSIITSTQNINDTKKIKQELAVFTERVQAAFKCSRSAIWEWSSGQKNKAWWPEELCDLIGWSSSEIGSSFRQLLGFIHNDDRELFIKSLKLLSQENKHYEKDIRIKTKQRQFKWFRISAKINESEIDNQKKVVGTLTYIHEKKQAEHKLKKLNEELERFAYLASHDLKEPLNTITSFIGLFKEEFYEALESDAQQYLQFIEGATIRMGSLIKDLLAYSQLENVSLKQEANNLNLIVADVLNDIKKTIHVSGALICVSELPKEVICDRTQIRQLFQNLITNSIKYQCKNTIPKITIGCVDRKEFYEFFIKDNGIGIHKKHYKRIFEVFKRLHLPEDYEGNGIGLANCNRIINNHHGNIWLTSELNSGTTFYFTLPK